MPRSRVHGVVGVRVFCVRASLATALAFQYALLDLSTAKTQPLPTFAEFSLFIFARLKPVAYLAGFLSAMRKMFHFVGFQHKALGRIFERIATNDDKISK